MDRKDIAEKYKWSIEDIYGSVEEWQKDYDYVKSNADFKEFVGKLDSVEVVARCFKKMGDLCEVLEKLSVYAMMKRDENAKDSLGVTLSNKIDVLDVSLSAETSFITTELSKLSDEKLKEFANENSLKNYDLTFNSIIKSKPHVLGDEAERVLSLGGQVFGGYHDIFSMIDNADFPFPTIEVGDEKVTVTHGVYSVLMQNPDRSVREKAFKSYYKAYNSLLNTITAVYVGNVNKNVFLTRVKKFNSCLERSMFNEEVETEVYDNLIKCVHDNLPKLHDYIALRKKVFGFDEMHMYDVYLPITEGADLKLEYEEAFELVKKGLSPLGEDYQKLLCRAFNERWIDVFETEGKRSGAYSVCVYALKHPYVLLNYQKTTHDVFTIAHELGHALHSFKSNSSEPREKSDYRIFVAEVASTVNEVLLLKYLLATSTDVNLKKYLLSYYLDMLRTTLFRQTQFAEFEYKAHTLAEQGEPLSKEVLNEIYLNLNKEYYGNAIISDEEISYEWSRIPHFYTAFYVYKYATGIISAVSIAERILSKGEEAVQDYFKFLSSGCSDTPTNLLKITGVDLLKSDAYSVCMTSFKNALGDLEKLL